MKLLKMRNICGRQYGQKPRCIRILVWEKNIVRTLALTSVSRTLVSAISFFLTTSAIARHSVAMYDEKNALTLTGAISAFHSRNPHCSIDIIVSGAAGEEQWSIQLGPPTKLFREDWKPLMFKPGTKISARVYPVRDGTHRALVISSIRNDESP